MTASPTLAPLPTPTHITPNGHTEAHGWQTRSVGSNDYHPKLGSGSARRFGAAVALSGSGDIATVTAIPQRGSVLAPGALVSAAAVTAGIIVFIPPAVVGPESSTPAPPVAP